MKKIIIGSFSSQTKAESFIAHITDIHGIPKDHISYAYRGQEKNTQEAELLSDVEKIDDSGTKEGATTGAMVGGSVGVLAGIATVAGVIPVIGPIFAAGPLLAMLGIGAGAVGTTAAAGLTGALAGGLVGALTSLGATEEDAKIYEEHLQAGDVLVLVQVDENEVQLTEAFSAHEASSVRSYTTSGAE